MENYAVIQSGGKQYQVSEGDKIQLDRIEGEAGTKITFNEVLLANGEIDPEKLSSAKVEASILEQKKAKKVIAFKKKRRKGFKKKIGHRQELTEVLIEKIS
ncbi:UNVERIFIED_CONTAM: hypothetical protein GTU68_028122 [Idotea baltica]|nr:hypothetical protein [Idotea baltica]